MARIVPLENFWNQKTFQIGIREPRPTSISGNEYQQLVEEAINIWQETLIDFANNNSEYSNLADFQFHVHRGIQDNDDIKCRWWYSNENKFIFQTIDSFCFIIFYTNYYFLCNDISYRFMWI